MIIPSTIILVRGGSYHSGKEVHIILERKIHIILVRGIHIILGKGIHIILVRGGSYLSGKRDSNHSAKGIKG